MIFQRVWAGLAGAGFLVVGVLRFIRIPSIVDLSVPQPMHGMIHLTTGAALFWSAFGRKGKYAEPVNLWVGLVFVALGLLGLPGVVKYADNSLHLFVGTASAAIGGVSPWSKRWLQLCSRYRHGAMWALSALLCMIFVAAGLPKLLGNDRMVEEFQRIGLGQWLRYISGAVEVGSAGCLLVPRLRPLAAGLLVSTMIGASIANVEALHRSAILPAMLVLLAFVLLGWSTVEDSKEPSQQMLTPQTSASR